MAATQSILVVDDDAILRRLLLRQIEQLGFRAVGAGTLTEALAVLDTDPPDLVLLDQKLPDATSTDHLPDLAERCPVIVLTAHGSVDQAVGAVKAGAADYLTKPISPRMLELAIARVFEAARLRNEVGLLRREVKGQETPEIVGHTAEVCKLRERARMLAEAEMPVLIHGESGAGKRTVARFIHENGPRAEASFAELQCARADGSHLADELFGAAAPGLLEAARGGTLFLSDIGRMPQVVQRRLAAALETGAFTRRGSAREIGLQVRVIAASSQGLPELAAEGGLVPELFYILTAFTLEVPPLRARRADIPELANHFLSRRRFALDVEKTISRKTLELLQKWDWPGNLRELRNVVERGVILSGRSATIQPDHVELGQQAGLTEQRDKGISVADEPTLEQLRDRYLDFLLQRHDNNRRVVAGILGISERSLYRILSQR
ncbi:DNA-binding transcriptional response regulator, NtrC family, contains REC, AAA-type ATPase, and a Fis-type DNA-binding domains [Jhaorihella thermophila]|uniref:DNA-binding transcriptional response regulator, NtrC family, contains REC, AAA-type ATPase, and a Fis-type DNA-binding domains n=4 Tax=Jhaorihella thermophila TaxID=488547 RepID=A0A1H5YXE1_9RHOB|nr:DNA-binding transcriptional response regulator, NtrC family, contains REC, AAA-type ATPase, and a Fis-type DNA-binding domains [Jhaorihella thermophila]